MSTLGMLNNLESRSAGQISFSPQNDQATQNPQDSEFWTWESLNLELAHYSQWLPLHLTTPIPSSSFVVVGNDPKSTLLLVFCLLKANHLPILCNTWETGKNLGFEVLDADLIARSIHKSTETHKGDSLFPMPATHAKIGFLTSGSTGTPKIQYRSFGSLLEEGKALERTLNIEKHGMILSSVGFNHLYGMIFGVILPLVTKSAFRILNQAKAEDWILKAKIELYVSIPSTWRITRQLFSGEIKNFVVSGSPLGEEKESDFSAICHAQNRYPNFYEVLGSTETGAIGFRNCLKMEPRTFHWLEGVKGLPQENHTLIESSFHDNPIVQMADRIQLLPKNQFVLFGRSDRIVKYASTRISLDKLSDTLNSLLPESKVVCDFIEMAGLPKGGLLVAYIESQPLSVSELRFRFTKKSDLPFPNFIYFCSELPKSKLGKIDLNELRQRYQPSTTRPEEPIV